MEIISGTGQNRRALQITFTLTFIYFIVELIGGILTNSLALLADAAHMLTDVGGLALALFATWIAKKPATPQKTYGYYRVEILAALANAVVLFLISFYILYEAYRRFEEPPEVASVPMLLIAVIGLAINLVGIWNLHHGAKESLNVHGAYLEVVSDALGSVGVIVAAVIMLTTRLVLRRSDFQCVDRFIYSASDVESGDPSGKCPFGVYAVSYQHCCGGRGYT